MQNTSAHHITGRHNTDHNGTSWARPYMHTHGESSINTGRYKLKTNAHNTHAHKHMHSVTHIHTYKQAYMHTG